MLKSLGVVGGWVGGWPTAQCQPQSLWVLDLIWTWLGLGQGGFGTMGLGLGLDNNKLLIQKRKRGGCFEAWGRGINGL